MFLCGNLRRAQLFSKYGLKSYPTFNDVGFHTRLIQQQNGNVILRRRAQIKQLARPMAERQIGHRKSSLVLSARFPCKISLIYRIARKPYWIGVLFTHIRTVISVGAISATKRSLAAPIYKLEIYMSDRYSHYTEQIFVPAVRFRVNLTLV